jgi:hypothetical protein
MSRQEQFKQELFELLRRYKVEMVRAVDDHYGKPGGGINFWSYTQYDADGNVVADKIDLRLGSWENGKE